MKLRCVNAEYSGKFLSQYKKEELPQANYIYTLTDQQIIDGNVYVQLEEINLPILFNFKRFCRAIILTY